jgi:hypothetical protein
MIDNAKNTGLTPERTARLIASLIALTGMVFLFLERVLSAVLVMASDGVKLGLTRYNNFTGQFAAQNFAEDKKLLGLLKEVQSILPTAESALTIFMIVAIVLLVIAAIGFALPRQTVHVLVALKLLKWQSGEVVEGAGASFREVIEKVGNIPLKKLAIPCAVILAIVIGTVIVRSCHEGVLQASVDSALEDLKQNTSAYIDAQKAYFGKNKVIGGPKALQLPDSASTNYFDYKITATKFVATSKVQLENCPAGTKWSVFSNTKGLFDKELTLYRKPPQDTACVKLLLEFKNLGRK